MDKQSAFSATCLGGFQEKPEAKKKAKATPTAPKPPKTDTPASPRQTGMDSFLQQSAAAQSEKDADVGVTKEFDTKTVGLRLGCDTDAEQAVCAQLNESDSQWHTKTKEQLCDILSFAPGDGEALFRSDTQQALRDVSSFLGSLRTRRRTLKRRTAENSQAPLESLQCFEQLGQMFQDCLKVLGQNPPQSFGPEAIKRAVRWKLLDDLKYQRWCDMIDETYNFLLQHGTEPDPERMAHEVFSQQICVALQKMIKGIDLDKAWTCHV